MPPHPTAPPPSLAAAAWLTAPATQLVFAALAGAGHAARAVGGAVRNTLLGLPVSDIDIATTATPEQTIAAAQAAGLKVVPTGLAHGTVTVIADGVAFEVTTLRRDIATDGRHATVAFTTEWAADAARRDFTINALYCDAGGRLDDPLGGYPDLKARRVRFVGDAHARIREDYLRILRFFRFSAIYAAGPMDASGLAASIAERAGLAQLSAERIRVELLKLFVAPRARDVLATMERAGLLSQVLAFTADLATFDRLVAIEAATGTPSDAIRRLAALGVRTAAVADALADRLRLANPERAALRDGAASTLVLDPTTPEPEARRALYRLGAHAYRSRVLLAAARGDAAPGDPRLGALATLPDRWTPPRFPLAGRDLIARGVPPGPLLGAVLAATEAWWLANDFPDAVQTTAELDRRIENPPTVARPH